MGGLCIEGQISPAFKTLSNHIPSLLAEIR
jgi:hypothetical protein